MNIWSCFIDKNGFPPVFTISWSGFLTGPTDQPNSSLAEYISSLFFYWPRVNGPPLVWSPGSTLHTHLWVTRSKVKVTVTLKKLWQAFAAERGTPYVVLLFTLETKSIVFYHTLTWPMFICTSLKCHYIYSSFKVRW